MPISADSSPNIKWPLPEGEPAQKVENIFPEEMLQEINLILAEKANWGPGSESLENPAQYHTMTGRWVVEVDLPQGVLDHLESLAKTKWKKQGLRLKNIWFARYQKYKGITPYLWEHMDQPGTQYTMDICIDAKGIDSWGLLVDGERYEEAVNSGVFFMGQQQTHARPPYPNVDEDAYVVLMFVLFVSPEHWMYDIDAYDPSQYDELHRLMAEYKLDGDIRYYEYRGYSPRLTGIPESNYECLPGGCGQCNIVAEDFTDHIPGYIKLK